MILNPYNDIQELGNDVAHIATDAEKTATIMSDVDGLSNYECDCIRHIYIYAYSSPPIQLT